jgi:hypothetical protein
MDVAQARRQATRRRRAWWAVVALLAALGLTTAPTASAAAGRTLLVEAPATVVAGVPFDVTVTVVNPVGKVARAYQGTLEFSTDDALVRALPDRYTLTRADRGTHTFTGVTLVGTGTHRLEVEDVRRDRVRGSDVVTVTNAGATLQGQVLSEFDPVTGGFVTVYDAVTGLVVGTGPANIEDNHYSISGLPAGDIKVGATVPTGGYEPDFANDRDALEDADVFTLRPGQTLVQSFREEDFGPYLDVEPIF